MEKFKRWLERLWNKESFGQELSSEESVPGDAHLRAAKLGSISFNCQLADLKVPVSIEYVLDYDVGWFEKAKVISDDREALNHTKSKLVEAVKLLDESKEKSVGTLEIIRIEVDNLQTNMD